MIKGILVDLSGVIYTNRKLLPGTRDALISLYAAGIPTRFITNTTRLPRSHIMARLMQLGITVNEHQIFTPAIAARNYLLMNQLSPYLLVHQQLAGEFNDLIKDSPQAVLVGDAADNFTYRNLNTAFRLLKEGLPLLAMGSDRYTDEIDGPTLDLGPFVKAPEYAADTKAIVLGKPSLAFFLSAVSSLNLPPEEVAMIGDEVFSDIVGAMDAGIQSILVKTGKYRQGDERIITQKGGKISDNLDDAIDMIL